MAASPVAPVFGQSLTLDATVSLVSPDGVVPTGSVTFKDGSTYLGTATLEGGVAELSTTPPAAGGQTITVTYGGDANDQPSNVEFSLTVAKALATLELSNLSFTYNGAPQSAVVTTIPGGLPGVMLTYSQNGVAVSNPTHAGEYTVTATLNNSNYTAQGVTGTMIIGQATPILTWAQPDNIIVGTPLARPSSMRAPPSAACRCRAC